MIKFSKEEQAAAKRILSDPILWAKNFIKLPTGDYFEPSFVQKKIFNSKKKRVVVCVHRRAGKTYALAILVLWLLFTKPSCKIIFLAPGEPQIEKFYQTLDELLGCNPHLNECIGKRSNSPYRRSVIQGDGKESYIWGFVAQKGSKNIRGQEADYVLIDECDFIEDDNWASITPVIDGDRYRLNKPTMYATSTPGDDADSLFMKWVANTENDPAFEIIHVPVDKNEDYTAEEVRELEDNHRRTGRTAEYEREWLLKVGYNSDKQVFKARQVEKAGRLDDYVDVQVGESIPYPESVYKLPKKREGEIRVIGVDWDRIQAGPCITIAQYLPKDPFLRVIWREEIDNTKEHLYNWTCQYIMDMWDHVQWDHLMSEATKDTMQIEVFQILAKSQKPHLLNKIRNVDFNENYETLDHQRKEVIKRRLKQVIVGNLQNLFENDRILYPKGDKILKKQLLQYKIIGHTTRGPSYSKENEHFIDALGMCAWAFFEYYDNPFKNIPVTKVVAVHRRIDDQEIVATTRPNIPVSSGYRSNQSSLLKSRSWGRDGVRSRF